VAFSPLENLWDVTLTKTRCCATGMTTPYSRMTQEEDIHRRRKTTTCCFLTGNCSSRRLHLRDEAARCRLANEASAGVTSPACSPLSTLRCHHHPKRKRVTSDSSSLAQSQLRIKGPQQHRQGRSTCYGALWRAPYLKSESKKKFLLLALHSAHRPPRGRLRATSHLRPPCRSRPASAPPATSALRAAAAAPQPPLPRLRAAATARLRAAAAAPQPPSRRRRPASTIP
jgi:hypothetical protein